MPKTAVTALARWTSEAQSLPMSEPRFNMPLHVLQGEAVDVARFFKKYYAPVESGEGRPGRPGLSSVANAKRGITKSTGDDILSLQEAVQQATAAHRMAASPRSASPADRARFVIGEIAAVLEWHFDDGVEDQRDAQLEAVKHAHEDTPDSADALAAEADDYAALASVYRAEIDGLGGFDAALIDEASALAAELRQRPASAFQESDEARQALALRNRLANLLYDRISVVRGAARFVFRNQPDIVREVTSAYERRRRAASRRGTSNEKKAPGTSPGSSPA